MMIEILQVPNLGKKAQSEPGTAFSIMCSGIVQRG